MAVQASSEPILDVEATLLRLGGDKALFGEMIGIVLEDAPGVFAKLREAVEVGDATAVRAQAHAIKGLLAGCGGVRAARVAQALEDAGKSGHLQECGAMLQTLEREVTVLTRELQGYRE